MSDGNGALPEGWEATTFGELFDFKGGSQPPKKEFVDAPQDGYIRLLQIRDFASDKYPAYIKDLDRWPKCDEADVMIARYGASLGRVLTGMAGAYNVALIKMIFDRDNIDTGWARYFLMSSHFQGPIHLLSRSAQNGFNKNEVSPIDVQLPPLAEQRRIVSKIESLQERSSCARRALSEVGPLLEQFRQSVLRAAFSGRLTADWRAAHRDVEPADRMVSRIPAPPKPPRAKKASIAKIKGDCGLSVGLTDMPIPPTWSWTALTRLGQLVTGHTPSRKHPEYWDGDIAWIGIKDAGKNNGRLIEDTLQHVTELGIENSASRMLPKGTVLMTRTANSIGYSVVLGREMATSQDLVGWILPEEINPKFVMYLILAEHDALYRFAKGSAHPTVYFPEILSFHVALPPTDEQNEIVKRVEEMLGVIDQQTSSLAESESALTQLDQSILAKAFRGELVPQDPRDEPASELLARIRTTREAAAAKPKKKPARRKRKS
jgi:type I restriction enzyme, S subunit